MGIETRFPVRQTDGSYRIPDGDEQIAVVVWGTARYWAERLGVPGQVSALKWRMADEFRFQIFVDEGGCSFLLFPEKAARAAYAALQRAQADGERRKTWKEN